MKGYRTIIFSAAMTLIGLVGVKVSPATANNWGDIFVTVWGIGAILLRQITTTPVGGLPAMLASVASQEFAHLKPADITELQADVQKLLGHFGITLQTAALTVNMAQKLDTVASTVETLAAATNSASVAPLADAAVVSALAGDGLPSPSSPVPAQPAIEPAIAAAVEAEAAPVLSTLIAKVV